MWPSLQQVKPKYRSCQDANTHIVVVVLYGLACEVEHSPRYDTLTDEVANFKVCSQDSLQVFILKTDRPITLYSCISFKLALKQH